MFEQHPAFLILEAAASSRICCSVGGARSKIARRVHRFRWSSEFSFSYQSSSCWCMRKCLNSGATARRADVFSDHETSNESSVPIVGPGLRTLVAVDTRELKRILAIKPTIRFAETKESQVTSFSKMELETWGRTSLHAAHAAPKHSGAGYLTFLTRSSTMYTSQSSPIQHLLNHARRFFSCECILFGYS